MSCSLTPPQSNRGNVGKEDTNSTSKTGVDDATIGKPPAIKVPMPSTSVGASLAGSGIISESDLGSLGSSSIDAPSPISRATNPSADSLSKRSITAIGSLSGTISLREYDDDNVVPFDPAHKSALLVYPSMRVTSRFKQLTLIACLKSNSSKPSIEPTRSYITCNTSIPTTRSTAADLSESRHISAASILEFKRTCNATVGSKDKSIPAKHLTSARFHINRTPHITVQTKL
ncbi:hypothetical protein M9H77_06138 [Catharanthus roseus]|uniref:Uncharacterized protein n=1 Tax=Catharanthus roseus TaxID=4058 RepID=A0ACC0BRA0_CATRO|nr:hypothetical protein M9H77_06138 [Catharanthus roseus]